MAAVGPVIVHAAVVGHASTAGTQLGVEVDDVHEGTGRRDRRNRRVVDVPEAVVLGDGRVKLARHGQPHNPAPARVQRVGGREVLAALPVEVRVVVRFSPAHARELAGGRFPHREQHDRDVGLKQRDIVLPRVVQSQSVGLLVFMPCWIGSPRPSGQ